MTASSLLALQHLANRARALATVAANDPLRWVRWTPSQDEWLRLNPRSGSKLFRAGNQVGKTWAGMAEVIWRATGTHPYCRTRTPPVEVWVVCTSWSQSVAIQRKFWDLVPRDQITPAARDRYRLDIGWGKDNPTVLFLNGSVVRFRTTNQGPEALSGATVDYVAIDEPPDQEVFRELQKRVQRRAGHLGMTLTPVNRDCVWIRKLVEDGVVEEVHAPMTPEAYIPLGTSEPLRLLDGTPMDAAWIAEQRRITPSAWAPVVLDGEWETRPEGAFFTCFDVNRHVSDVLRLDPRRGPVRWVLGLDYATADRQYGHCAVLSQVQSFSDEKGRTREAIYARGEVALSGTATNVQFVQDLLALLESLGLRWSDLSEVHGDNPVETRWQMKSNLNTMRSLANEMGIPQDALRPRVLNAKDGARAGISIDMGAQYLYERIATGNALVHPACPVLIKGLETWDLSKSHPFKDIIDAWRYGLKPYIQPRGRVSSAPIHLYA